MVSFSLGPVFFILLDTSIRFRFREEFIFSTGALVSDISLVILLYQGMAAWLTGWMTSPWFRIVGGTGMILFGIFYFFKRPAPAKQPPPGSYFIKGLLLNSLNPGVPAFWVATLTLVFGEMGSDSRTVLLFFSPLFLIVVLLNLVKIHWAGQLRKILSSRVLQLTHKITGTILAGFGIFILIFSKNTWF